MSLINIKRLVDFIKPGTTSVYSPLIELIVNGIEAIKAKEEKHGKVTIVVLRDTQLDIDYLKAVKGFKVTDNGIGFTEEHRNAFDTLYTEQKIAEGGKGFGRFVCLKYFQDLNVESHFKDGNTITKVTFSMGKKNDILKDPLFSPSDLTDTSTTVTLFPVKSAFQDKMLQIIARNIVERILPYFIRKDYLCPLITIAEEDGSESFVLNDYANTELGDYIKELPISDNTFRLMGQDSCEYFKARVFKFYSPKAQRSKISLVANRREVTTTLIHNHIPEFNDEFYDKIQDGENVKPKNYIIRTYVFGKYLDNNVSYERGGFEFPKDPDLFHPISQNMIEKKASTIAENAIGDEITKRQEKKRERVQTYVDHEAPWHRTLIKNVDLSDLPFHPSNEDIESTLQAEKYRQDVKIRQEVNKLLDESTSLEMLKDKAASIVANLSENSKNDLAHYVVLRRSVLDIFKKSLESQDGKYSSEGVVHDIIFPRKGDSDRTPFEDHNLWIVDERLNFTSYVSSDLPLNGPNSKRSDLIVYDKRVLFRGDNEASNPVTIFEFKKPNRDDFVNPSSKEDPVGQIVRYVNDIRDGRYKTPEGRPILVADNTPFYGYVVCELSSKVENWLQREKNFKPMPDRLGWFQWLDNINLYIEVLSWDKVLRDATIRNKIFFHKLGI